MGTGHTQCEPWLLYVACGEHCFPVRCRPCWFRRQAHYILLGWWWEPNPACPLPGYAHLARRRPEPADDSPGWMETRR